MPTVHDKWAWASNRLRNVPPTGRRSPAVRDDVLKSRARQRGFCHGRRNYLDSERLVTKRFIFQKPGNEAQIDVSRAEPGRESVRLGYKRRYLAPFRHGNQLLPCLSLENDRRCRNRGSVRIAPRNVCNTLRPGICKLGRGGGHAGLLNASRRCTA